MKTCLLIFFSSIFICCKTKSSNSDRLSARNADTVRIYLQKNQRGVVAPLYSRIKRIEKLLDLRPLEQGSDSFELRIWRQNLMLSEHKIFILKFNAQNWSIEEYTYSIDTDAMGNEKLIEKQVNNITPKEGWPAFLEKVKPSTLGALTDTIPAPTNIGLMDEGFFYGIEISTRNSYIFKTRILEEIDMPFLKDDKLVTVIKLFQSELSNKR